MDEKKTKSLDSEKQNLPEPLTVINLDDSKDKDIDFGAEWAVVLNQPDSFTVAGGCSSTGGTDGAAGDGAGSKACT